MEDDEETYSITEIVDDFVRATSTSAMSAAAMIDTMVGLASPGWHPTTTVHAVKSPHGMVNPSVAQLMNDTVLYCLFKQGRSRVTRVLTMKVGRISPALKLNDYVELYDARAVTGGSSHLGRYEVVGVRRGDNGQVLGDVPDRMVAHVVIA